MKSGCLIVPSPSTALAKTANISHCATALFTGTQLNSRDGLHGLQHLSKTRFKIRDAGRGRTGGRTPPPSRFMYIS